jgi:hypothetical protein
MKSSLIIGLLGLVLCLPAGAVLIHQTAAMGKVSPSLKKLVTKYHVVMSVNITFLDKKDALYAAKMMKVALHNKNGDDKFTIKVFKDSDEVK